MNESSGTHIAHDILCMLSVCDCVCPSTVPRCLRVFVGVCVRRVRCLFVSSPARVCVRRTFRMLAGWLVWRDCKVDQVGVLPFSRPSGAWFWHSRTHVL